MSNKFKLPEVIANNLRDVSNPVTKSCIIGNKLIWRLLPQL